jgi:hypothetical protein
MLQQEPRDRYGPRLVVSRQPEQQRVAVCRCRGSRSPQIDAGFARARLLRANSTPTSMSSRRSTELVRGCGVPGDDVVRQPLGTRPRALLSASEWIVAPVA